MRAAFLCISLIVAVVSSTPRFHLCACRRSLAETGPGIRSEVGTNSGALRFEVASRGLGVTPLNGPGSLRPRRFLVRG